MGREISPLGDKKKEGLQFLQRNFWEKNLPNSPHFWGQKMLTSPYLEHGVLASRQYRARVSKSFYFFSLTDL
jgi:hypothetical protein